MSNLLQNNYLDLYQNHRSIQLIYFHLLKVPQLLLNVLTLLHLHLYLQIKFKHCW